MSRAAWSLLILGLARMAGDIAGISALTGLAAATGASPAPKVFSSVNGFETFSVHYVLSWNEGGRRREVPLTSELYAKLPGPYWIRNVYGAALSYGPVLPDRLRDPVTRFAFCGGRPALERLGFDPSAAEEPIRVGYIPRAGAPPEERPISIEVSCE